MANGHIEIHDPFPSGTKMERSTDGDAARESDTDNMEETVEFRLMMAYAQRRRGKDSRPADRKSSSPAPPEKTEREVKKKKKKKKKKVWKHLFTCIKPRAEKEEVAESPQAPELIPDVEDRMCNISVGEQKDEDELEDAAAQLTQIADDIPFTRPPYEPDTTDDLERVIGLLLRESGDRLNERVRDCFRINPLHIQELKNLSIAREIFWNYSFYRRILTTLLTRMGLMTSDPDSPGPHASPKAQIAVTCEATSRLSALDTQPMNRLLGYGARFLSEYYSSWAQEQGGYEAAFNSDDEDEDVQ